MNSNQVLIAYSHFEAMSQRSYAFNCVTCGHYPHILIADVNRKVAFKYRPSEETELKDKLPFDDYNDEDPDK